MIDVMSLDSRKISYCTYHIVDLIPKSQTEHSIVSLSLDGSSNERQSSTSKPRWRSEEE